ncbi:hypothetical protein J2X20_001747 [Pelomonas saccharophila]|uniref:Uncharacterized protein n=1 Tax=Roseateles saccharophilus TaxID=304 RepID=A0ABU1YJT4_ROSSA|nr:hypothetical protein [Roseateles saccharophilus]MDR7269118.1 hypothetical protein [Roseateles saccharophilus]
MLQTVLAATGLVVCIALGVHMALPYRWQARVDAGVAALQSWAQLQFARLTGWRRRQRQTRAAALEAERVIRRARESALHDARDSRTDGEWDGNVYRPKSFEKPKKPH